MGDRLTTIAARTLTASMKDSAPVPRHLNSTVAALYAGLVVVMWLPFGASRGMPYETTFSQWSENYGTWAGFFFQGDPLRPHTNTFYHLSYLLSHAVGIPGSFATFEWVYAALWWARGFLVYLILAEFLPARRIVCAAAGALVLSHAADGSLQWVGQMNQCGVMFWMLSAFYVGLRFLRAQGWISSVLLLLAVIFLLHMSLWSYEAQLPIVLLLPFVLFFLRERRGSRRVILSGAWYLVAAVYIGQTALRYLAQTGTAYQQGVLRKGGISFSSLLGDWWFNIWQGARFWDWTVTLPRPEQIAPHLSSLWSTGQIAALAVFAAALWLG